MPKSLFFILLFATTKIVAQQEPQSTLFTSNYASFNPAMSGLQYKIEANVLWRNQWTQVNGAPSTLWANYTQRINKIHGAAGVIYSYDYIGMVKTHTALANYAFHLQSEKILWSIGASAGMKTFSVSYSDLVSPQTQNDPYLDPEYSPAFQVNAGLAMHTEKLNLGFSVTKLNQPSFRNKVTNNTFDLEPTYHLHGDYSVKLSERWNLIPALHLFSDLIKLGSTTSIRATFANKLWFGVNAWNLFASNNSFPTMGPMLGYDFKQKFRVGYSLEFNQFNPSNSGQNLTHEVVLSFLLK